MQDPSLSSLKDNTSFTQEIFLKLFFFPNKGERTYLSSSITKYRYSIELLNNLHIFLQISGKKYDRYVKDQNHH